MKSRSSKWVRSIGAVVLIGGLVMGTVLSLAATTQAGDPIDDPTRHPHLKSWSNVIPAARRFVVLADFNNAAVLDRETGLVWERSPETKPRPWDQAVSICTSLTTGGRKGWRLPSVHELASLIDPTVATSGLFLPAGHPFTNVQQAAFYWSATTHANTPTDAWVVNFSNGDVDPDGGKTGTSQDWCVRGPMNADQY